MKKQHQEKFEFLASVSEICPTCKQKIPENAAVERRKTEDRRVSDLYRVVKGWKALNGIPLEGPESASWDKVHFARCAKSAKALIQLFGDRVNALRCMELVYTEMVRKKLSCTIETIVKHSDLYREKLAKQEVA